MSFYDHIQYWNCTPGERLASHPADRHSPPASMHFVRAVDVDADAATIFRWLCQIKVAPYSYDLLDNLGRRSPRSLTPGADELELGQLFLVGRLVAFETDRSLTIVSTPSATSLFGSLAISYEIVPGLRTQSRIVACVAVQATSPAGRLRRRLLGIGDLPMMRKQLLTLKALAEEQRRAIVQASR